MSEDKHGNHFEFHFHNTVGQNIGHVDTLIANFDKDMKMQTALVDNVINEEVASQDSAEQEEELNYFQPTNHLKRLLADDCISDLVSDHQYTGKWFEAFVDALMASECRDEIARGIEDRRDRHRRQNGIREIVEEGPDKTVLDLFTAEYERQGTDQIRDSGHNEKIKEEYICTDHAGTSFFFSS